MRLVQLHLDPSRRGFALLTLDILSVTFELVACCG